MMKIKNTEKILGYTLLVAFCLMFYSSSAVAQDIKKFGITKDSSATAAANVAPAVDSLEKAEELCRKFLEK